MTCVNNIEVGPLVDEAELAAFLRIVNQALFFPDADPEVWIRREGKENIRVARRSGQVVGGLSVQKMGQWFGGKSVPMAGVRAVGVAPEHRRGGVASQLMRAALDEMHRDGVPLSALFPATQPVYRRAGYEQAGVRLRYRLPAWAIDLHDRSLLVRPIEPDDHTEVHQLYAERARRTAGNLERNAWAWQRVLDPPPWQRPAQGFLVQGDGKAQGYVVFAQKSGDPMHKNELEVGDIVAGTHEAARRILTFLADHRSMVEWVNWYGPPADGLLLMPDEQPATITERIDWMLRLVDVRAALELRGYPADVHAELHFETKDDVLPHNQRRFVFEVADGQGQVREGGRGELRIDVRGLAALYSGHLSPFEIRTAGYLDGPDRALVSAGSIFSGPAPWMPDIF